jgi:uncharacterized protein with GYD domain
MRHPKMCRSLLQIPTADTPMRTQPVPAQAFAIDDVQLSRTRYAAFIGETRAKTSMLVSRITTVQRMTASGDAGTVEGAKRKNAACIMFSNLTDEGHQDIEDVGGSARSASKIESMGARDESTVLGGYDFVNIISTNQR